jgi:hypothetical protein
MHLTDFAMFVKPAIVYIQSVYLVLFSHSLVQSAILSFKSLYRWPFAMKAQLTPQLIFYI